MPICIPSRVLAQPLSMHILRLFKFRLAFENSLAMMPPSSEGEMAAHVCQAHKSKATFQVKVQAIDSDACLHFIHGMALVPTLGHSRQ